MYFLAAPAAPAAPEISLLSQQCSSPRLQPEPWDQLGRPGNGCNSPFHPENSMVKTSMMDHPSGSEHPNMCVTIWLFNIAIENSPFIDDFPTKTTIYRGFSMAMLNNQRVYHSKPFAGSAMRSGGAPRISGRFSVISLDVSSPSSAQALTKAYHPESPRWTL